MTPMRVLVFGNSGSGKSWLAARLAAKHGIPAIDLDAIHWEPDGYSRSREKGVAISLVREAAAADAWIIEGVYGWLLCEAAPRATTVIWLDIAVGECLDNLRSRGLRGGADAKSFADLLDWAADYPHRQTSSSQAGHAALFAAFQGQKARLSCRNDVVEFRMSAAPT
jgi:hypothetical protein